jgi:hypothetical protein
MATAPTGQPEKSAANLSFSPTVQVGPTATGYIDGYYYASSVAFYVETGPNTPPSQTYAWYSPNQGGTWVQIPNNQQFNGSGNYPLPWVIIVPTGNTIKFLMGPP